MGERGTTTGMVPTPTVYDHLRPTSDAVPDGIYRVVGTDEETITLLRVADVDRTRRSTGTIVQVGRPDLDGFEPAANPDGNRPPAARLRSALAMPRWAGRAYLDVIRDHPIRGGGSAVVFVLGLLGGLFDLLPGLVGPLLVVGGGLGFLWMLRRPG